jgi:hypothetical protein
MCNKLSRCCALHRAKEMELDNAGEYEYGVLRVVTEWAGTENRTSPDNIPWFDSNAVYDSAKTASTWSELGRLERLSLAIANIAPYSPMCVEGALQHHFALTCSLVSFLGSLCLALGALS